MNNRICFVLVETTHSGNIGAAARAMKTMGFDSLRLVNPCKYLTADSLARASGADDIVKKALVFDTLEEAIADCTLVYGTSARSRTLEWAATNLDEAATDILSHTDQQAAVVFGRERSGLSNDELDLCHHRLAIPSNPDFSSLNLGSAVQVTAYELRKQMLAIDNKGRAGATDAQMEEEDALVNSDAMERFYHHLERVMVITGFLDPENPRLLKRRIRRLFARSQPRQSEMQILRGILTAVEKAIDGKNDGKNR